MWPEEKKWSSWMKTNLYWCCQPFSSLKIDLNTKGNKKLEKKCFFFVAFNEDKLATLFVFLVKTLLLYFCSQTLSRTWLVFSHFSVNLGLFFSRCKNVSGTKVCQNDQSTLFHVFRFVEKSLIFSATFLCTGLADTKLRSHRL